MQTHERPFPRKQAVQTRAPFGPSTLAATMIYIE
jgi:hypothetical protein